MRRQRRAVAGRGDRGGEAEATVTGRRGRGGASAGRRGVDGPHAGRPAPAATSVRPHAGRPHELDRSDPCVRRGGASDEPWQDGSMTNWIAPSDRDGETNEQVTGSTRIDRQHHRYVS